MLRAFCPDDEVWLRETIEKHALENVYLYIDAKTYGFAADEIKTWIAVDADGPKCILYQYYNSLQLLQIHAELDAALMAEICDFVAGASPAMLSGERELIDRIQKGTGQTFYMENGFIFRFSQTERDLSGRTVWARYDQCGEIAGLICSDRSIGGHYSVPLLRAQLEERMKDWGCKSRIILENGKIVSHMATYAEADDVAVMAGLVTGKENRGQGLGRCVLTDLALALLQEKKEPLLYCYKDTLWDWYLSLGWEKIQACAKLEKR